ncbi:MAG: serine/threonine-protein phosphatase, partial [Gammaproteobacteria bacterium]
MSTLSYDIAGSQIDGARDYQEDAFLITHLGDSEADTAGSMVIVADGMGGHAAGNVASNMAVQTFNRHLSKNYPSSDLASVLYDAVLQANGSITATVAETAALKGMGCTLVACVLERSQLRWVSVGDSHLYLLRDGTLRKMNADHSYGGFLDRMAAAGTPVEAEAGFSRNMLMSALTGDDIAEIDCPPEPLTLAGGDRVILASDGLDTLPAQDIIDIASHAPTAKNCVDALLHGVTDADAPRQDNTTIVVIDVLERVDAAAPPSS